MSFEFCIHFFPPSDQQKIKPLLGLFLQMKRELKVVHNGTFYSLRPQKPMLVE